MTELPWISSLMHVGSDCSPSLPMRSTHLWLRPSRRVTQTEDKERQDLIDTEMLHSADGFVSERRMYLPHSLSERGNKRALIRCQSWDGYTESGWTMSVAGRCGNKCQAEANKCRDTLSLIPIKPW